MARPDIKAIAERADKATRGPWIAPEEESSNKTPRRVETQAEGLIDRRTFGYGPGSDGTFICNLNDGEYHEYADMEEQRADAEFIAHAREDVPALLMHIEEQDAEIAALRNAGVAAYLGWRYGWDISGPLHRLRNVVKPTEAEDAAYRERMGIEEEARLKRIEEYNATVEAHVPESAVKGDD